MMQWPQQSVHCSLVILCIIIKSCFNFLLTALLLSQTAAINVNKSQITGNLELATMMMPRLKFLKEIW